MTTRKCPNTVCLDFEQNNIFCFRISKPFGNILSVLVQLLCKMNATWFDILLFNAMSFLYIYGFLKCPDNFCRPLYILIDLFRARKQAAGVCLGHIDVKMFRQACGLLNLFTVFLYQLIASLLTVFLSSVHVSCLLEICCLVFPDLILSSKLKSCCI